MLLAVLLHFVFKQFFFILGIVHDYLLLVIAEIAVQLLTHNYVLGCVLLIPVNDEEVQAHAEEAVNDLNAIEHFLYSVVVGKVVDEVLVLVALAVVFENAVKIAPVNHCHRTVSVSVATVAVEPVNRILQPIVALLFQRGLIHKYMIKHCTYLEQFQGVQYFAEGELLFPQNKTSLK